MPTISYAPRGAAITVLESHAPMICAAGPAGTGKTMACLVKIMLLCLKYPGSRYWLIRKTRESLTSTTLVTWREKVAAELLANKVCEFYGGSVEEPAQYRFSNGSVIMLAGLDKPSKLLSSEVDAVFIDEATEVTEADVETISTRLRNGRTPHPQILMATNPGAPSHWIRRAATAGRIELITSLHEDNPMLFTADGELTKAGAAYIGRLDMLTGVRLERLRHGRWAAAEGVIFEDWNPTIHLINSFGLPRAWPRYWSIDWGHTNPTVVQFWAVDPDGRLFLYREWVRTLMLVKDHAEKILSIVAPKGKWREPKPKAIIADHDGEARGQWRQHVGIGTKPADKRVVTGIEAMQARLRVAGDGRPRLFVMRNALVDRDPHMVERQAPIGLAEEIEAYVWAPDREGRATREEPVKVHDHSMDAARYMVMHLDQTAQPNVRYF